MKASRFSKSSESGKDQKSSRKGFITCVVVAAGILIASTGCTAAEIMTGSLVGLQGISVAQQMYKESHILAERKRQTEELRRQTVALERIAALVTMVETHQQAMGGCPSCSDMMADIEQ